MNLKFVAWNAEADGLDVLIDSNISDNLTKFLSDDIWL